jgi:hypothetical protein
MARGVDPRPSPGAVRILSPHPDLVRILSLMYDRLQMLEQLGLIPAPAG